MKMKQKKTILVTVLVTVLTVAAVAVAAHIVAGINITNVHEPDFQTLFPDAPIGALGTLLPGGFVLINPDDTLWLSGDGGTVARLQSACYEGVGAADGLYAYVYQVDCTGGIVWPYGVSIPLSGATLDATGGGLGDMFTYIATKFDPLPWDFEPLPWTLFTGNLVPFNLSEFGGSFGIGGNTAAGWTDASLGVDEVLASSTTDNFWSGTLVIFVTDAPPVISHVTVTSAVPGGPSTVAALVPWPGVGPTPDLPPDDIIVEPPEVEPILKVAVDIKPGSFPNSVNPCRPGVLPIAILGSADLDVGDIDVTTITVSCMGDDANPLRTAVEDVNGDGIDDLVFHMAIEDIAWCENAEPGDLVNVLVVGQLLDDTVFAGEDVIRIVPPKKKGKGE